MKFYVYHTQEFNSIMLKFAILAKGNKQWLGDGYYFWEDLDIAKWWGGEKKCKKPYYRFTVFAATLDFSEESYIDTVFNEDDYRNFVAEVEKFAKLYSKKFKKKPTLEEFNDFIQDFDLWEDIKVIRFQDVPTNDSLVEVTKFYYKKRIQIRVNDPEIIVNFAHLSDFDCV